MFKIWFIALCLDCKPYLPLPFETPELRDSWAETHRTAGLPGAPTHRVETGFEIRRGDPRLPAE